MKYLEVWSFALIWVQKMLHFHHTFIDVHDNNEGKQRKEEDQTKTKLLIEYDISYH